MGRYNFLEEIYKIPDSNSSVSVVDFTAKCSPEQDKGGERLLSLLEDIHVTPSCALFYQVGFLSFHIMYRKLHSP